MRLKMSPFLNVTLLFFYFIVLLSPCLAQQEKTIRDQYQYMLTDEQKLKLQIIVHIWGEVNRPGQYVVPDGTNILELISMAGGPTEFSSLSRVKLTREWFDSETGNSGNEKFEGQETRVPLKKKVIYNIDLNKHLNKIELEHLHVLKPGDVVNVKKNMWHKFQTFVRVLYQVAIIAQGLYYYSRIFE